MATAPNAAGLPRLQNAKRCPLTPGETMGHWGTMVFSNHGYGDNGLPYICIYIYTYENIAIYSLVYQIVNYG